MIKNIIRKDFILPAIFSSPFLFYYNCTINGLEIFRYDKLYLVIVIVMTDYRSCIIKKGGEILNNLELMSEVESAISVCKKCPLSETRNKTVPGEGSIHSPVVFIGEGPGAEEDVTGRPFVGKAGRLFDEILKAVSFSRDDIYITNVVKCRPPNNRNPMPDEMNLCSPFLFSQLQIINPILIVTLGAVPLSFLLDKKNIRITSMRGQLIPYRENTMLFPMFHPSYLLRNPSKAKGSPKFLTWQDIQEVKKIYDQHRQ